MTEADSFREFVTPKLVEAGWLQDRLTKSDEATFGVSGAVELNSLAITAFQASLQRDPALRLDALNRERDAAQIRQAAVPALLEHVKAGKLTPLAVGSQARSPALPDVPTVAEQGYPGFEVELWLGVFAPAGTPAPVIARLNRELVAIAATADFKAAMERSGAEAASNSPAQFAKLVSTEADRYSKVFQTLGVKLD